MKFSKEIFNMVLQTEFKNGIFEYKFHDKRKWRFDFAIPDRKIALEYEGIASSKSRHTTLKGYSNDCIKYNEASKLGWKVYRFTVIMENEFLKLVEYIKNE